MAETAWRNLNEIVVIASWSSEGHVIGLSCQSKTDMVTHMEGRIKKQSRSLVYE